jgi:hypothetical protein
LIRAQPSFVPRERVFHFGVSVEGGGQLIRPPLKWSDLKYVFRHQGGSDHAKEETHT